MQKQGIVRMDWPACRSDLNPKHISLDKNAAEFESPQTLSELEKDVNEVWENISIKFLMPYWESMKKRVVLVKKSKGPKILVDVIA